MLARVTRTASWLRALMLALLTVIVAGAAGVFATVLVPTTVSTDYYTADVRLSPSWSDRSSIRADTVVGGVTARFAGLAPGIVVEPRVREEISEVVAGGSVSTSKLVVGEAERDRLIREAAKGVSLRFVIGTVAGAALVVGGHALSRRRLPRRGPLLAVTLAWLLTCAAGGVASYQTYARGRAVSLETTGLLRLASDNASIFSDVEARADQATPYLRNLLALSSAVRSEYAPADSTDPAAVTVLLVSDVHASNQYALMRTIVRERDVDVVVDTGDLVNLGRVEEVDLAGLDRGISSLGVPYVFVRGNHDATSARDRALLERLAEIDGVYLPDPGDGTFAQIDVEGLRIAGFNDPRYYGDADDGSTDAQVEARDRWVEALGDAEPPDLTLGHEEPSLADAPGRLRVHGHGHVPGLEGNRLAAGTFTGGGTLSHFSVDPSGQELVGAPSSFDVLTFGPTCEGQTLTRYQYRAIIEGRPSMDSIAIINAREVVDPVQEGRTCGEGGVSQRPLGG